MKKLISLLMVLATLLPVCSFAESANMDDFLAAVSQGVKARLAYSEAHPNNENSEDRLALVRPELEFVSKYEGVDFGNKKFNELAKSYIAGCRMQESATTFYDRSYRVYQELWAAGLKARSVTLVEFYEDYGLDLTRDEMDSYYDNLSSNNVQIEFAGIGRSFSDEARDQTIEHQIELTPTPRPIPEFSEDTFAAFEDLEHRMETLATVMLMTAGKDSIDEIAVEYIKGENSFRMDFQYGFSYAHIMSANESQDAKEAMEGLLATMSQAIMAELKEITEEYVCVEVLVSSNDGQTVVLYRDGEKV